jgi:FkbH-like protein
MASAKKCLVWDLDNTLWDGVCLEGAVRLRPEAANAIAELDRRGILHSVASRGDAEIALAQLRTFALEEYFLAPKINWLPKPTNILAIGRELDIPLDAMAFVDDEPFELEQVVAMLPDVTALHARQVPTLATLPEFTPSSTTLEASSRRQFYRAESVRKSAEQGYQSRAEFLRACDMRLTLRPVGVSDVPRVVELMTRTHQLNTTGLLYSPDEVRSLAESPGGDRVATLADLTDRFGEYGTIGVGIVRTTSTAWALIYLALSCRVLGRGIERAFLAALLRDAARRGYRAAEALYRETGRNRQMRVLYQVAGFRAAGPGNGEDATVFRLNLDRPPEGPDWVALQ